MKATLSRRQFLVKSALSAAAVSIVPRHVLGGPRHVPPSEKIHIGNNITVTVVETNGNRVRLSIEAPDQVRVLRGELTLSNLPGLAPTGNSSRPSI